MGFEPREMPALLLHASDYKYSKRDIRRRAEDLMKNGRIMTGLRLLEDVTHSLEVKKDHEERYEVYWLMGVYYQVAGMPHQATKCLTIALEADIEQKKTAIRKTEEKHNSLTRINIPHPGKFTIELIFRRCNECGFKNIVKEEWFECAVYGAELSVEWNLR